MEQSSFIDSGDNRLPTTKLAYYAGLFDGEGHISLNQANPHMTDAFALRVIITLGAGSEVLTQLERSFGGSTRITKPRDGRQQKRIQTYWTVIGGKAVCFLRSIYPYLEIKKDQVDLALNYYEQQRPFRYSHPIPKFLIKLGQDTKKKLEELKAPLLPPEKERDREKVCETKTKRKTTM